MEANQPVTNVDPALVPDPMRDMLLKDPDVVAMAGLAAPLGGDGQIRPEGMGAVEHLVRARALALSRGLPELLARKIHAEMQLAALRQAIAATRLEAAELLSAVKEDTECPSSVSSSF